MKKREVDIGDEFGMLVVIALAGSDHRGNQLVRVRCSCPNQTEKIVRLTDLTHAPYVDAHRKVRQPRRSCGCEARRFNREFWDARAKKFRMRDKRRIWRLYQQLGNMRRVAERVSLPQGLVAAICRQYYAVHPERYGGAIPKGSQAYREWGYREDELPF